MNKILCVAFIALNVGMAVASVGQMPKAPAEPFSWWIPLAILGMMGLPAVLGYMAGREDAEK